MDLVLAGLQWAQCLVYIDDVIVMGRSFDEHLLHVFDRLLQAGLSCNLTNVTFFSRKSKYLGHIVSKEGISPDPAKIDKIVSWPLPRNTKEVQQFLGLAGYYRRFIQDFSKLARPLHQLTERNCTFKWTPVCQAAFETLKKCLCSAPILGYPDYSKRFILDTDASDTGIGAVLSQLDDDGNEHVVAFASRLLTKPERRYCVTRRELLAVVAFTKHFRHFLIGCHFTLRTDHGSLTWLRNFKDPEARWLEQLQEYDFVIVHRQGKKHANADALSRVDLPCKQCGRDSHEETQQHILPIPVVSLATGETLAQLQIDDPDK